MATRVAVVVVLALVVILGLQALVSSMTGFAKAQNNWTAKMDRATGH